MAIRVLIGVYADAVNAQNINGLEIARRLPQPQFEAHMFYYAKKPDVEGVVFHKTSRIALLKNLRKLWVCLWGRFDVYYLPRVERVDRIFARISGRKSRIVSSIEIESALHDDGMRDFFCNRISSFFAISRALQQGVKERWGREVDLTPLGFCDAGIRPQTRQTLRKAVFVGSLVERKRPECILRLAKEMPDVEFVIVGDGPLRDALLAKKAKSGLTNIEMCGEVPNETVYEILAQCDLLLIPSANEGQPKVALEAASLGVPTCYIQNVYTIDFIEDCVTGFAAEDYAGMREVMYALRDDPAVLRSVSENVLAKVQPLHWDRLIEQYTVFFRKVAAKEEEKRLLTTMRLLMMKHNVKAVFAGPRKTFDGFVKSDIQVLPDCFPTSEYRLSNDFYGIARTLKKVAHHPRPLRAFIEHGVYFGDYVNPEEAGSLMPALITFGSARREHIRAKSEIPVLCVGPYIVYAKPYFSDAQHEALKGQYGKILLAFPQHTIEGVAVMGEETTFVERLKALKEEGGYDTVLVCLYYRELAAGAARGYRAAGFAPVCAGNRQDPMFLSRLKSFILLADFTVSDNVGTHIGYCEALGRHHLVLDCGNRLVAADRQTAAHVPELYLDSAVREKEEVWQAFAVYDDFPRRQRVVERYWGTDCILPEAKLSSALHFLDDVYRDGYNDVADIQKKLDAMRHA